MSAVFEVVHMRYLLEERTFSCRRQASVGMEKLTGLTHACDRCELRLNCMGNEKLFGDADLMLFPAELLAANSYALTQESVGHTDAHFGSGLTPAHSVHFSGTI